MILIDAVSEALRRQDPLPRRLLQAALTGVLALPFVWLGIASVHETCYDNVNGSNGTPTLGTPADDFCQVVVPGHPTPGDWQVVEIGAIVVAAMVLMVLPINRIFRVMLATALVATVVVSGLLSGSLTAFEPGG